MDLINGIQNAVDYIEAHLTEELDYEAIARRACVSSSDFQRIFSILCGYSAVSYTHLDVYKRQGMDKRYAQAERGN